MGFAARPTSSPSIRGLCAPSAPRWRATSVNARPGARRESYSAPEAHTWEYLNDGFFMKKERDGGDSSFLPQLCVEAEEGGGLEKLGTDLGKLANNLLLAARLFGEAAEKELYVKKNIRSAAEKATERKSGGGAAASGREAASPRNVQRSVIFRDSKFAPILRNTFIFFH